MFLHFFISYWIHGITNETSISCIKKKHYFIEKTKKTKTKFCFILFYSDISNDCRDMKTQNIHNT